MPQENNPTYCASPDIAYVSAEERSAYLKPEKVMVLTPWTVQNICYEVIKNYMLENPPKNEGYAFSQTYDADPTKTGIELDIAYHYKDSVIQKRPAVYISRGDATAAFPTLQQSIGANNRESEKTRFGILTMPINCAVVATNVGFAEQFAEYIYKIFFRYQETLRCDFSLRQLKLLTIGQPNLYLESKDHFMVNVQLMAAFDLGAVIKGDHLKLKTISYTVFTSCAETPLLNQ